MAKCPHPNKKRYPTRDVAEHILHLPFRGIFNPPVQCYRCRCGNWHLTSHPTRKRAG